LSYHQKAFAISDSLGDQSAIGISLASMASSYAALGDIERAIQTNIRQIEIHRRIGKLHGVAVGLQNIALLYSKQGKSERKYEYTQRALAAYQSIDNQDGIITASLVLGDYFLEQNRQLDSTLWYAKKAFQLSEEIDNNHNKALSLVQIARVQLQQKKPQTAVRTLLTALPSSEASGIHNSKIQTSLYLCQAYSDLQDYNKAITYGERALQTAQSYDDIHLINQAHQFLYPNYEAVGSFEQAMNSYKSYIAVRDSIQSEDNQQAIAEAVYEYEAQLDEAKIAEQAALLEQQQLRQRLSWIGLGALGVIATLLLIFGIAIRKRNRTLNKRNEEKAFLIKEIHHRVKN
jgi:tetratricopeptide (TPR) repeat protein